MMYSKILFLFSILFFTGCLVEPNEAPDIGEVEGLRPIYVTAEDAEKVRSLAPRSINRLGKIYYKDPFMYVNESNLGVHVIDNSDPSNPINIKFLQIPGCEDVAIKGNYLYADNVEDLITVDISDLDNPLVVNRIEDIQPSTNQNAPDNFSGYFECADLTQGMVIGWEKAILNNPKCSK